MRNGDRFFIRRGIGTWWVCWYEKAEGDPLGRGVVRTLPEAFETAEQARDVKDGLNVGSLLLCECGAPRATQELCPVCGQEG